MRGRQVGVGALLIVVPPLAGIALGMIPFDGQITTDAYVVSFSPPPAVWMLLGGVLLLLGLRWRRP